jgi:PAS domain S-box-containing protein
MSSSTTKRSLTYWLFFIAFLLIGGPIMSREEMITPMVHLLLDNMAAIGAAIATILVFKAYKETRAIALAFIGIALAGSTILQLLHVTSATSLLSAWVKSDVSLFMPWTWITTQSFMALALLASTPFIRKENFGDPATTKQHQIYTPSQIAVFWAVVIPVIIYVLMRLELPPIYYAELVPPRTPEATPAFLLAATLLVFVRRGNWRNDSYGHWLNVGLVAFLVAQVSGMAFSKELFDSSFTAAHLLKIVGYGCIIFGFARAHRVSSLTSVSDVTKPKGLGLGAKLAILSGFIGFICVMPIAMKSSQTLHDIAAENGINNLSSAAANASAAIEAQRLRVDADLEYLASTPIIESLNRASQNGDVDPRSGKSRAQLIAELSRLSQNLLYSDTEYLSFAYIDAASGKPIIRSEQTLNSDIAATNRRILESGERELSARALSGGNNESMARSKIFFLQDVAADVDSTTVADGVEAVTPERHLQIEGTALAVYSNEIDSPLGVFVMYSNVTRALATTRLSKYKTNLYVVNSDGLFVIHPDMSKEFSTVEGTPYTVADEFPGLNIDALMSVNTANGTIYEQTDGVEVIIGVDRPSAAADAGEQLLYIYTGRRDDIEQQAAEIGYEMQLIAQINLVVAILIGWFFARRFAKPVQQISSAAVEFGRSGKVTELPADGRDEIGMLAKSLTEMMTEVTAQREKLALLAAAVESSVDSTIITTIHGNIEYVNPHYERYAGITAKEVLGKNIMDLSEFKENRHILSEAPAKKGDKQVWTGELETRRADGKRHTEAVTISPILNAKGENTNQSMVIEDVTERRTMEKAIESKSAELQRSNYDLEQFAYVASHDLKSPLRAIEVLVDWLKEDLEDYNEGDVQENLSLLLKRTNRLNRLLDDLLTYSRAGRKIGDVKKVDTKDFVEDIASLIAPPEGFVIEADDSLPTIVTHHAPLETVFRNLISNAIKHSPIPEEGRIYVSAEDKGDMVEFSVQDNGTGIPPEYAEKVFKMFQTLQARDEKEGSGMGLAIVKRIIDWQGGDIWFHEGPDGKGAVFKFTWNKAPRDMPEIEVVEVDDEAHTETTPDASRGTQAETESAVEAGALANKPDMSDTQNLAAESEDT